MNSVLCSWLAAAAVAPFVVILSCWTLAVFRSYRSDWRLLDIFLYALTCLEVVSALFCFGYAVLGAIRPDLEAPCKFLLWGLTATRVFHLSTVTSLLLDRAFAAKWPSSYRSSVRHSQVRYHVIVLAIISVFVGVTSVFARLPNASPTCSLHPLEWDAKFSVFLACVYAFLLLTGLGCCMCVQASRFKSKATYRTTCSRDSSASNSSASCEETRDLEWAVVASVCWLSYMVNHGPYLVLSIFAMAAPSFWSPWLDNSLVWLRLVQGLMVPCVLLVADMPHRSALRNMLRQSGRFYRHLADHGGFRMQTGDPAKAPFPPYRAAPFPQRLRWSPAHLPSLQSLQPLDADSLQKGYGTSGYTTLLSMPSSTLSFPSSYSSCSSAGQSLDSVTTNAVNDFVFRRPSVMALFEPSPQKTLSDNEKYRRCDTPTPFLEQPDPDMPPSRENLCTCKCGATFGVLEFASHKCQSRGSKPKKILSKHFGDPGESFSCESLDRALEDSAPSKETLHRIFMEALLASGTASGTRQGTSRDRPAKTLPDPMCHCDRQIVDPERGQAPPKKAMSQNMINIILAYENAMLPAKEHDASDCSDGTLDNTEEERSSTSSESSDADSVQSVIIRQRVDRKGRVAASDISRVEKKVFRSDRSSDAVSTASDDGGTEKRILYSEYL